jgi:Tol biopolymer transport system component
MRKRGVRGGLCVVAVGIAGACVESGLPEARDEAPPEAEVVADFVQEAVWSADGRRLVASWYRGDRYGLFGLLPPDADGMPPEPSRGIPLTEGVWASWSPDGLWVAFETSGDGNGDVYRARPDGTGPENLTLSDTDDGEPEYSPDGRRIAFTSAGGPEGARIWIMDADGREPRRLSPDLPGVAQHGPAWSPDGRRIAFYATAEGGDDTVYVASADGSVVEALGAGAFPSWSRDGRRIYFDRNDSIFWRAPEGGPSELVVADGFAARPSPDGRWLTFARGSWPVSALFLFDLETGTETRISR